MTFEKFIKDLYKGIIHNKETIDVLMCEIDNKQQNMRDDGEDQTPDYEDLDVIYYDLVDIKKHGNAYPYQLKLHTTAEDIYKFNIVENIEDNNKGQEDLLTDLFNLTFEEKPSLEEMDYIRDALEDNASDMSVYDLFDSVHIDNSNKHLFPHDNVESGDKETLEKIYVDQCFKTYKEMSREELISEGMLQEEEK